MRTINSQNARYLKRLPACGQCKSEMYVGSRTRARAHALEQATRRSFWRTRHEKRQKRADKGRSINRFESARRGNGVLFRPTMRGFVGTTSSRHLDRIGPFPAR